ncbi:MAG: hypothetical protein PUB37_04770, partial [Firmicutes bacterium]|nr:hypothetical protein [Bacillota bacterium]
HSLNGGKGPLDRSRAAPWWGRGGKATTKLKCKKKAKIENHTHAKPIKRLTRKSLIFEWTSIR